MRSVTVRLDDLKTTILCLGYVGENEHTRINIDAKKMYDQYPSASASLTVCPPEGESYPAVITRDGDMVIWDITDSDLVAEGSGEIQLSFTQGETVAKTFIGRFKVSRSLVPTGDIPSGLDDFLTRAGAALTAIPETIDEALAEAKASGEFDGADGQDGQDGADGFSPIATVTKSGNKATISITDANGTTTAEVTDGADGAPGQDGAPGIDGFSPRATVSKSGSTATITITDAAGTTTAQISDGESADIIDDTAGAGDTNKVWSADKSSSLLTEINSKYTKPQTGIPASDLESGVIPTVPVQDVQANGVSILNAQGVASIPLAGSSTPGVMKVDDNGTYGVGLDNGELKILPASDSQVKEGTNVRRPLVPANQDMTVFYGLAKLAGADMASLSGETVGVYPDAQKVAIQKMLGIYESTWELIREDTVTNATEADVDITVDGDGNAFELTDVYLQVWTPQQETAASIGDYGSVRCFYNNNNSIGSQMGSWTQSANASAKYGQVLLTNENGAIRNETTPNATQYTLVNVTSRTNIIADDALLKIGAYSFSKITIKKVTGTVKYKLYGKRKWTA